MRDYEELKRAGMAMETFPSPYAAERYKRAAIWCYENGTISGDIAAAVTSYVTDYLRECARRDS